MPIRVYLVDDHAIVRDGLRALLECEPGIQVIGDAASGHVALQEMADLQPDVVVLDISMPDMNGIEIAEKVPSLAPHARVIMLSIYGTPELVSGALRVGARGYLLKESAGREVVNATNAVHAGQFYLSQAVMRTLIADYLQQRDVAPVLGPFDSLSAREREVMQLVVEGWSSAHIAERMHLSPKTVETYRSRMMHKLDVTDLPHLMKLAIQHGLISIE